MNSKKSKSKSRSVKSEYAKSINSSSRKSIDSTGYGPMPRTPWTGRTYDSTGYGPMPRTPWTGPMSSVKNTSKKKNSSKTKVKFSPKRLSFSPRK